MNKPTYLDGVKAAETIIDKANKAGYSYSIDVDLTLGELEMRYDEDSDYIHGFKDYVEYYEKHKEIIDNQKVIV